MENSFIVVILFLLVFILIERFISNKKISELEDRLMALVNPKDYKEYKKMDIQYLKEETRLYDAQAKVLKQKTPEYQEFSNV